MGMAESAGLQALFTTADTGHGGDGRKLSPGDNGGSLFTGSTERTLFVATILATGGISIAINPRSAELLGELKNMSDEELLATIQMWVIRLLDGAG